MKRFTDTEIWDKEWFMALSIKKKCIIRYLFDKCDASGVWTPNWILISAQIGETITVEDLNGLEDHFEWIGKKIYLTDFIEFQYGKLSENCRPHDKIFSLLKKHNLLDRVSDRVPDRVYNTLQEEDKDKEEEKDKEIEKDKTSERGSGGKHISRHKSEEASRQEQIKRDYGEIREQNTGLPDKEVFITIRQFIVDKKPSFAEPYVDIWNIFAQKYHLEKVSEITQERRDKIRIRTREPSFDFVKILQSIQQHKWYTGDNDRGWKITFNYLIKNETNYVEIIEKFKGPEI